MSKFYTETCSKFIALKGFNVQLHDFNAQKEYTKHLIQNVNSCKVKRKSLNDKSVMDRKITQYDDYGSNVSKPRPKIQNSTSLQISKLEITVPSFKEVEHITEYSLNIDRDLSQISEGLKFLPTCINEDSTLNLCYLNPKEKIEESISVLQKWFDKLDINKMIPLSQPASNLAPYVLKSETLVQLLNLGVDLSKIECIPGVANFLIKMNFQREIVPILWKLHDFSFSCDQMARLITVFPKLLKLPISDLNERLNYFIDRKISRSNVIEMVVSYPKILEMSSIDVDKHLGKIKLLIGLKDSELRSIVVSHPKIIIHPLSKITDSFVVLTKMMGFSISTSHNMIENHPKLITTERERLVANFVLMNSRLNLKLESIQLWPSALSSPQHILLQRSTFLVRNNLFQPDPSRPLFTPLSEVVALTDSEFCKRFGRVDEDVYDDFLRTL